MVWSVDEELVLRAGLQRAEPGYRGQIRWSQPSPFVADGEAEIRRDALGKIDLDIGLLRTVGPGRGLSDLRQRHLVGDERVVRQDRRGEEPFAG